MLPSAEFVSVNEVSLHVRRIRRDAPALVFIHGLTDSAACWGRVAEQFASEYDVVAVDLRGHGLSSTPASASTAAGGSKTVGSGYSTSDHAGDVIGTLEALGLFGATLIGHSLGADTAVQVAQLRPDLLRQLILEDPPWSDDWTSSDVAARCKRRQEWADSLERLKLLSIEDVIAQGRTESPHWVDEEILPWAQSKLDCRTQALDYILTDRPAWQLVVRTIRCPTMLVIGETKRGGLVSRAMAAEAKSLAALEVLQLVGAGHCVHRDQFAAYISGVRRFLADS